VTADASGDGRSIVELVAPDAVGLLDSVCRWFSNHGVSIEAAEITTADGLATNRFLVTGTFHASALAKHLSEPAQHRLGPLTLPRCRIAPVLSTAARRLSYAPRDELG
jgi:UTP:GlnB (protein PII) uridylyltransferase